MRAPSWVRGGPPPVEEVGAEKMRADVAAERLHVRGLENMPLDKDRATREATEGERALRSSRPKNRRWRGLDQHDAEVEKATRRHAQAVADVQGAEEVLARAPQEDAAVLAQWMAGGERGSRPGSTVYECTRERDANRLLVDAAAIELDRAVERRRAHIEAYRTKMTNDARTDLKKARERLSEHARLLAGLREAVLAARDTLAWIVHYPEQPPTYGFPASLALGLRQPVERTLATTARVEFGSLLAALEEDASALEGTFAPGTAEKLGTAPRPTPLAKAMWRGDPDERAWAASELQRARQLAEYGNVNALAAEVDDYRADP